MLLAVALKAAFIMTIVVAVFVPLLVWGESRQSALMQDRVGANRAAIGGATLFGLFHPLADLIKLLAKENVVPEGANRVMHALAPTVAVLPVLAAFAVIPYGGSYAFGVSGDRVVSLVAADLDWGLLYVFACASLATYGTVMAGWASHNNWSLLGSMRGAAQMISYQVPLGLSIVGVFMVFGSLKLSEISALQDTTIRLFGFVETLGLGTLPQFLNDHVQIPRWGIFLQPLAFVMFLVCLMAQNRRPPFDLPESGSELVAGYVTEYSGARFGLFRLAGLVQVVVIAAIMTALFLGGWSIPYLSQGVLIYGALPLLGLSLAELFGINVATALCLLLHMGSFFSKMVVMIWLQLLLRWSLSRFRYDQLMDLCWKRLVPLSLLNVFATAALMLALGDA